MSKPIAYTVELRNGGNVVGSVRMDVGCAEVIVGRSHESTLRTPADDHSISGRHMRIFWRGKNLYVEDAGSRNGVYCKGARLTKAQRVDSGDVYSIGNCVVCCEKIEQTKTRSVECHRLERLNGDEAGRQIDIRPKSGQSSFTIGLDPGNTLVLPDMLVSRKHAEFEEREGGECWIRDLGSRNGTYVNGEVLRGKERLLKDNDTISIAYFDFRFLDKSQRHTRFFLWLKVFVVAVTLCVMAGAYVAWMTTAATAEDHLRVARDHAAACDFLAASNSLVEARMARDADRYRAQIDTLESQVDRWQKTWSEWQRTKVALSDGELKRAQKMLDPLTSGVLDAWVWNGTSAIEEKRQAEFAARAIRWLYDAFDVIDETGEGLPERRADAIREKSIPLAGFMEESKRQFEEHPYLEVLYKELGKVFNRMTDIQAGFAKVDGCIAKLDATNPDFAKLTIQLDEIICDKSLNGAVRAYADKYKQLCAELADAKFFIRKEFDYLNAMRFAAVRSRADNLRLPSKDICARHPQLSDHRLKLERHHLDAQTYAENLESMVNGLSAVGVVNGDCGDPLKRTLDVGSWNKAFTFSCFNEKPPATRRKEPSGFYDELLGIDFTFQSLRALPDNYNGWCLRMIGFSPDVVEARKALEYVDVFVKYMDERPVWLSRGELGAFCVYCRSLQERRDRLLEFLFAYNGDPRAQLIARFYSGWFARKFELKSRKDLSEQFRAIQRKVSELSERYSDVSDPVEQISIRAKMLSVGFPGDAQLHSKWVQKFEGGGR